MVDLRLESAGTIDTFGEEGRDVPADAAHGPDDGAPSSTLTYEPFYGLTEKPFSLSPDPRFLYRSASHAPVLHELLAAIRRREGLVVLTGDIGTGKTTLCRAVIEQLDQKTFTTFVPDPFVTRDDLLKTMLIDFGVMSVDDLVKGRLKGASRADLSFPLYEFLRSLEPLDAFAVLVIDEVQNLSLPLLEEIRILSDLEADRKLLQVVLIGQPEFDDHLRLPRMRQIRQRVSVHCQLQPLDREGVAGYVSHRLRTAGATPAGPWLSPQALDLVHETSGGVPRVINLLCDKALAHGQRQGTNRVGADLVRLAMTDMRLDVAPPAASPMARAADPAATREASPVWTQARTPVRAVPGAVAGDETARPGVRWRAHPSTTGSLAIGKVWIGTRRWRPVTVAALIVLGFTTCVSLLGYWLWLRPILVTAIELPPVVRPARVAARVGPLVLWPRLPQAGPGEAASRDLTWVIQAGAFSDPARAASLVSHLASLNYPAFERELEFAGQGRLRVAFAGPYGSREAAAGALEALRRIPGFEGALARPLGP
jgi:type II secretory pathway predicted ATPase ExeA